MPTDLDSMKISDAETISTNPKRLLLDSNSQLVISYSTGSQQLQKQPATPTNQ